MSIQQAIILTGAGGGVGREACAMLARQGYQVFAGVIDAWEREAVEAIAQEGGFDNLHCVDLDLRRHEECQSVVDDIEARGLSLWGLVLNGAASPEGVPVEYISPELLRDTLECNVVGNYAAVKACLSQLKKSRGRIIFISSATTFTPPPFVLPYVTSKAAMNAMALSLRRAFRNTGIEVSLLIPEVIKDTYMAHGLFEATKARLANIRGCSSEEISPLSFHPGANTALMQPEDDGDPFYEQMYQGQLDTITAGVRIGVTPARVCRDILGALTATRPKAVYVIGPTSMAFRILGRFLPTRWVDGILAKAGYR
tara:strand:- start:11279 stop:12214 length:936 start_codon:yes stop_codon:yes gene_type:complete